MLPNFNKIQSSILLLLPLPHQNQSLLIEKPQIVLLAGKDDNWLIVDFLIFISFDFMRIEQVNCIQIKSLWLNSINLNYSVEL